MSSKIKIFSKSKEGLKFVPFGVKGVKPTMMSWDEFNKTFEYDKDDKTLASLKPEWEENYKEVDEILNVTIMQLLHSNASQKDPKEFLISIGGLSSNIKRISEILGCTKNEAIQLVLTRKEGFINSMFKSGASFGKCHKRMMSTKQIKKNDENIEKTKSTPKPPKDDTYHFTLGDAIKK